MGLVELGKHTGLSPALLSKLERDLMHPTLATLLRIAMVFSVGLEYFFNPEPKPVLEIVRKKDRLRFPDSPDADQGRPTTSRAWTSLFPIVELNSYLADFEPGAAQGRNCTTILVSSSSMCWEARWSCWWRGIPMNCRKAMRCTSIRQRRMPT